MDDKLTLYLANPRGFCAGVERAIDIVDKALELYGAPVYVKHEIVHNKWVCDDLRSRGVIFIEEIEEIPDGAITVFSAHGVSQKVVNDAKLRDLPTIDATCPLVTKVHNQAKRYEREDHHLILIGHAGHPEVEGTSGQVQSVTLVDSAADVASLPFTAADKLAYVTQTTLSVDDTRSIIDALKQRYPQIAGPDVNDICYATQNRQNAVRDLAAISDLVLVVGSVTSSNSNRLRDLAEENGIPAYLIDDAADIDPAWLDGVETIGITAGASAPELLVERVIARLDALRGAEVKQLEGAREDLHFRLPPEVRNKPYTDKLAG
jgi:4-hydroxy-3-methylbut-2-enyl diphosphate reductase